MNTNQVSTNLVENEVRFVVTPSTPKIPLTRLADTLSPTGEGGKGEGARFISREGVRGGRWFSVLPGGRMFMATPKTKLKSTKAQKPNTKPALPFSPFPCLRAAQGCLAIGILSIHA